MNRVKSNRNILVIALIAMIALSGIASASVANSYSYTYASNGGTAISDNNAYAINGGTAIAGSVVCASYGANAAYFNDVYANGDVVVSMINGCSPYI